jgi:hypothetical protein
MTAKRAHSEAALAGQTEEARGPVSMESGHYRFLGWRQARGARISFISRPDAPPAQVLPAGRT